MMNPAKKATSIVLAAVLILIQLTALRTMEVSAAEGDADIGCYEYGYTSSTPYSPPADDYNPALYGENPQRVYHVSPDGSDATGDGGVDNPWASIGYAASRITQAGSLIKLAAGSWTVNARIFLAPGVSLEGAGSSGEEVSTITSTALVYLPTNVDNAIINLVSESVFNGGQHISKIRFDGNNRTASQAIEICGRENVAVHDCVFVDFETIAVGWRTCSWERITNVIAPSSIPSEWVKGGRFYSNTVTNCARYDSYARGALFCGGLEGFRIYDNIMIESNIIDADGDIETIRGVPIKFWYYDGWMLDCKIYGNTIHKLNSATSGSDGNGWPFAIESICHYGMEICGNDIIGAIDLNFGMSGEYNGFRGFRAEGDNNQKVYDYATLIHNNNIHANGENGWSQNAIILEYDTAKTIIERNVITDCASVLYFTPRPGCVISDVVFRYNQCTDIRFTAGSDADAVRIDGWPAGFSVGNLSIHNNLLLCEGRGGFGIKLSHTGPYSGSNINISNNIISGFNWNPLLVQNHDEIEKLTIQNNFFYDNGGWNGVNSSSTTGNITSTENISDYINSGNVELTSQQWSGLFVDAQGDDYHLKEGSAAIDAGVGFGAVSDLDGNSVPYGSAAPASPPIFTLQPLPRSVSAGESAVFSISVGGRDEISYQWQCSSDGGVNYTDVEGANLETLTLTAIPAQNDGLMFRCVATNSFGSARSNAVLLTVADDVPPPVSYEVTIAINGAASKLYEPWGLRFYASFDGDDSDKIVTHSIAMLKETYYTSDMTPEQLISDTHAHLFSGDGRIEFEEPSERYPNGRWYATLTEGIYSYDINAKYYAVPYADMPNGQRLWGTIRSSSMQKVLNANLLSSSVSDEEKTVCTRILALRDSLATHYASVGVPVMTAQPEVARGSSQRASTVVSTVTAGVTPNINGAASRLLEPWGLRFYAQYTGNGVNNIADRGIAFLRYSAFNEAYRDNPEDMRLNSEAFIFTWNADTMKEDAVNSRYSATLTEGVTSKDIGDVYYALPFAVLENGSYVYGTIRSSSMIKVLNVNISRDTVPATERAVSSEIVALHEAINAYYLAK